MNFVERADRPELMDTEQLPLDVMKRTLKFLGLTNRYLGGSAVVLKHLKEWSRGWDKNKKISILDVGTGGAEIPIAIVQWARRAGFNVQIVAMDSVPETVEIARENAGMYPEIS